MINNESLNTGQSESGKETTELRECPCGSPAQIRPVNHDQGHWVVDCGPVGCGWSYVGLGDREKVVSEWNYRKDRLPSPPRKQDFSVVVGIRSGVLANVSVTAEGSGLLYLLFESHLKLDIGHMCPLAARSLAEQLQLAAELAEGHT